jgi:hypothetical protein
MPGWLVVVFAFAATISAGATTLVPTDVPEMSREARTIAVGRVAAVDVRWLADRRGIETLVTLDAEEYIKGALGAQVQFLVPGGAIGRYRSVVVGAPQLRVGQRVVVFLGARGPGIPYILGFNQGLFRVRTENGESVVEPPATAMPDPAGGARLAASSTRRLNEFVRQVRELAGTTR